ncbi:MAG TPA: transglutaminase N-terminal domain-containing protein, partial [Puia sp.]
MKYTIQHTTAYTYQEPVSLCHNIARLMPRNTQGQICGNTTIHITPEPDRINEYEDFFGNKVIYFSIEKEHWELIVHVTSEVERKNSSVAKPQDYPIACLEDVKQELLNLETDTMDIKQYTFGT